MGVEPQSGQGELTASFESESEPRSLANGRVVGAPESVDQDEEQKKESSWTEELTAV